MVIQRWQPGRDIVGLREAMDRIWEDSFHAPGRVWGGFRLETGIPAVDMYIKGDEVVVKASLPGLKAEDVDVTISGDILTIKGESKAEEEIAREDYLYQERRYGAFTRTLTLPAGLNTDKVEAKVEQGILTLRIPKSVEARTKSLKVKVAGAREGAK